MSAKRKNMPKDLATLYSGLESFRKIRQKGEPDAPSCVASEPMKLRLLNNTTPAFHLSCVFAPLRDNLFFVMPSVIWGGRTIGLTQIRKGAKKINQGNGAITRIASNAVPLPLGSCGE